MDESISGETLEVFDQKDSAGIPCQDPSKWISTFCI